MNGLFKSNRLQMPAGSLILWACLSVVIICSAQSSSSNAVLPPAESFGGIPDTVCSVQLGGLEKSLPPIYGPCSGEESSPPPVSTGGSVTILSVNSTSSSKLDNSNTRGWIVLWDGSSHTSAACAEGEEELSGRFNATCSARFSAVLNGFAGQFTDKQLYFFLKSFRSEVASVHRDTVVSVSNIQSNPIWALDRLDQVDLPLDNAYNYYNSGTGVHVYIVDTGVRTSHSQFLYADGTPGSRADEVYTSLSSGTVGQDCNGHGTHVTGSVGGLTFGVAKNVSLHAVRALECAGNGTVSQVIQGLEWVQLNYQKPAVVAMSLGGDSQYALDAAVRSLVLAGVTVVVAAGNEDTDACTKSPSREPLAITVAATTKLDQRLWISPGLGSNYGPCVDVWAPGTQIESASYTGDSNTEIRSGTSQAVPFTAGAIALYLQNNTGASPADVYSDVVASGAWNRVRESSSSGSFNARVLDNTPNVLTQINLAPALVLTPDNLQILGMADGFGPYNISVRLARQPAASVTVFASVGETTRGIVAPLTLGFNARNWNVDQQVVLSVSNFVYATVASQAFFVNFYVQSSDISFDGRRPLLRVDDRKGDNIYYPKVINSLPFSEQSNTHWFQDDYNVQCAGQYSDAGGSPDVAYFFKPTSSVRAYISLCASVNLADAFDTKLSVFANVDTATPKLVPQACNDDNCGYLSQLQIDMSAGVAYAIVVDGFSGSFGPYQIDITTALQQGGVKGSAPFDGFGSSVHGTSMNGTSRSIPTWSVPATPVGPMPPTAPPTPSPPPPPGFLAVSAAPPPPPLVLPPIQPGNGKLGLALGPSSNISEIIVNPGLINVPTAAPSLSRPAAAPKSRVPAPAPVRSVVAPAPAPAVRVPVPAPARGTPKAPAPAPFVPVPAPSVALHPAPALGPVAASPATGLHRPVGNLQILVPVTPGSGTTLLEALAEAAAAPSVDNVRHVWQTGEWGLCSNPCGSGYQYRQVTCISNRSGRLPVTENPSVCAESALTQPAAQMPCNTTCNPGETFSAVAVPWQGCDAACQAQGESSVLCRSSFGRLLPASYCVNAGVTNLNAVQSLLLPACALNQTTNCPKYFWRAGPWSNCSATCGGGTLNRTLSCYSSQTGALADPSQCSGLTQPQILRACNTAPCIEYAWQVSPWGACSAKCGGGTMNRTVSCANYLGSAPDSNCAALTKPPSASSCSGGSCDVCKPDVNSVQQCGGEGLRGAARGVCNSVTGCTCQGGWLGKYCEIPPYCNGIADINGVCCTTAVDRTGACCPSGSSIDSSGFCCALNRLDTCGICGGNGTAIDIRGTCCAGVIDAGGFCCASGVLDGCGVCDGAGSSCRIDLAIRVQQNNPIITPGMYTKAATSEILMGGIAKILGVQTSSLTPETVAEVITDGVSSAFTTSSTSTTAGRRLAAASAVQQYDLQVSIAPGAVSTNFSSHSSFSVARIVQLFVASRASQTGSLSLISVSSIDSVGVCGNGVCEVGELKLAGSGVGNVSATDTSCPADCPFAWNHCPAPKLVGQTGLQCGGKGYCIGVSGTCACFQGYTGDDCGTCAPGLYPAGGSCVPVPMIPFEFLGPTPSQGSTPTTPGAPVSYNSTVGATSVDGQTLTGIFTGSNAPHGPKQIGVIVGSVVAVSATLAACLALFLIRRQRKRAQEGHGKGQVRVARASAEGAGLHIAEKEEADASEKSDSFSPPALLDAPLENSIHPTRPPPDAALQPWPAAPLGTSTPGQDPSPSADQAAASEPRLSRIALLRAQPPSEPGVVLRHDSTVSSLGGDRDRMRSHLSVSSITFSTASDAERPSMARRQPSVSRHITWTLGEADGGAGESEAAPVISEDARPPQGSNLAASDFALRAASLRKRGAL